MSKPLIIRKEIELKAPVSAVWDVLTNPNLTEKYMFGSRALSEWKPGCEIIWKGSISEAGVIEIKGKIIEIVPNKVLEYTCFWPGSELEDKPENYTTIRYELADHGDHTMLSISHGDFSKLDYGEKRYNESIADWDSILESIRHLAESA